MNYTVRYFTTDGTLSFKSYKSERGARAWARKAENEGRILSLISITEDEF